MKNKISKIIFFGITFLFLFVFTMNVKASVLSNINNKNDFVRVVSSADITCDSLLGDPSDMKSPAYWFQWILDLMKYIAIIALLVLVISDFFKAMTEKDKDAMKKAGNKAIRRFIYCVILFFVPIFVKIIMSWFGVYGNCLG